MMCSTVHVQQLAVVRSYVNVQLEKYYVEPRASVDYPLCGKAKEQLDYTYMGFSTFRLLAHTLISVNAIQVYIMKPSWLKLLRIDYIHLVPMAKEYVNCYILLRILYLYHIIHSSFTINLLNHHENNNIPTKKATGLLQHQYDVK